MLFVFFFGGISSRREVVPTDKSGSDGFGRCRLFARKKCAAETRDCSCRPENDDDDDDDDDAYNGRRRRGSADAEDMTTTRTQRTTIVFYPKAEKKVPTKEKKKKYICFDSARAQAKMLAIHSISSRTLSHQPPLTPGKRRS